MKEMLFEPKTSGRAVSKEVPTIVFLAGFPDQVKTWSKLSHFFEDDHHVIALSLPDYEKCDVSKFWGYSFEEIVDALHKEIILPAAESSSRLVLVGHDWGSIVCQFYVERFSPIVDDLVLLDVGTVYNVKEIPVWVPLCQILYMLHLSLCFIVSRLSPLLGKLLILLYPWGLIGPCPDAVDNWVKVVSTKSFKVHTCYPYFRLIGDLIKNGKREQQLMQDGEIKRDHLFCYGAKKRWNFHCETYVDALKRAKKSDCVVFKNCGHWLHLTEPKEVSDAIRAYLKKSD